MQPSHPSAFWGSWFAKLVLFCGCSVCTEPALHVLLFAQIDSHIVYPLLFGGMAGALVTLLGLPAGPADLRGPTRG